jgi:predicted AAA+ superfamily ATPase
VLNALNRRLGAESDPRTRGRLFESLVVLELRRHLQYARSEASLFFWRTSAGAEVDVVVEKYGRPVAACEVKSSRSIDGGDLSGLKAFQEEYPDVPGYVAGTIDAAYVKDGIRIMPWIEAVAEISALF